MKRILRTIGEYRIVEIQDTDYSMDDLKGDCFNPSVNTDIDVKILKRDEIEFEKSVYDDDVFGYVLEKWDPSVGIGWVHVDSCWGFIGEYVEGAEKYEHYIVAEFIAQAENKEEKNEKN